MTSLLIIGAGGHGLVVADAAQATRQWREIAFVDDREDRRGTIADWPIVGRTSDLERLRETFDAVAVAIGANRQRLEFYDRLRVDFEFPIIVHPRAYVSAHAELGPGTVVLAQAAINIAAVVGAACVVNTAASIDHDCRLADGVHVAPGASLAGSVQVGRCALIGVGSSVRDGIKIGANATLGAGAVAVRDVADDTTVIGVPAAARPAEAG